MDKIMLSTELLRGSLGLELLLTLLLGLFVTLISVFVILEKAGFGTKQQVVVYLLLAAYYFLQLPIELMFATAIWLFAFVRWPVDPVAIKVKQTTVQEIRKNEYPNCISISWNFASSYGGKISKEQRPEIIKQVENLIFEVVEKRGIAVNTAVITTEYEKAWQWYARNSDEFLDAVNEALASIQRLPIVLKHQRDRQWNSYRVLLQLQKIDYSRIGVLSKVTPVSMGHVMAGQSQIS